MSALFMPLWIHDCEQHVRAFKAQTLDVVFGLQNLHADLFILL